jgi:hypothetical protein
METRQEFDCECGARCLVAFEVGSYSAQSSVQHCAQGHTVMLGGLPRTLYVKRGEDWVEYRRYE